MQTIKDKSESDEDLISNEVLSHATFAKALRNAYIPHKEDKLSSITDYIASSEYVYALCWGYRQ